MSREPSENPSERKRLNASIARKEVEQANKKGQSVRSKANERIRQGNSK